MDLPDHHGFRYFGLETGQRQERLPLRLRIYRLPEKLSDRLARGMLPASLTYDWLFSRVEKKLQMGSTSMLSVGKQNLPLRLAGKAVQMEEQTRRHRE